MDNIKEISFPTERNQGRPKEIPGKEQGIHKVSLQRLVLKSKELPLD